MVDCELVKLASRTLKSARVPLVGLIATSLITLSACGNDATSSDIDTSSMGNATAVASPASPNPDGTVITLDPAYANVEDMERVGDIVALRSGDQLAVGTVKEFADSKAPTFKVSQECADMTASTENFILACPEGVYRIKASDPDLDDVVTSEHNLSTAVETSTGEIVAGIKDKAEVVVIKDGEEIDNFPVEYPTDEMKAVTVEGKPDAIIRTNSKYTIAQDIDWHEGSAGAILRVGKGVGQIASAEKGLFLASDNTGNQLALYFADDVIRLQKTMGVPDSPWAVAWDHSNTLAWVSTTKDNLIIGYDPSNADLDEVSRYNSVADVRNMEVLDDGTIIAASATGEGLQVIEAQKG